MKKLVLSFALVALIAAGCNKVATTNNSAQTAPTQSTNQSANTQTTTPSTDTSTNTQTPPADANGTDIQNTPQVYAVHMTSSGFSPATIKIKAGDYVQFINDDTAAHEPASDPYPTHTDYLGFDAKAPVTTGNYYRFQFLKVGTWGYHDHLNPTTKGTVIVE